MKKYLTFIFLLYIVSLVWAGSETQNVKVVGLKADGVTNAAPAIQKAIDKLRKTGGTVLLPAGKYGIAPAKGTDFEFLGGKGPYAINLPANVTLRGAGSGNTVLIPKVTDESFVGIRISGKNAKIEALSFASTRARHLKNIWAIVLDSAQKVTVRDCCIYRSRVGVILSASKDSRIIDCEIRECTGNGVVMYGSVRCEVVGCFIEGCGDGNCSIYANRDCHIIRCVLQNANQLAAIESSNDCSIRDSLAEGLEKGFMGIVVNRSIRTVVSGNTVRGVHHGIFVRETDILGAGGKPNIGTRITGNTIVDINSRKKGLSNYPLYISYGFATLISHNLFQTNKAPTEIRIDKTHKSTANMSQANCVISDNVFILAYKGPKSAIVAQRHPCIVSNVGVTVSNNSITSHGMGRISGLAKVLIDVAEGSIVMGNRSTGLPGLNAEGCARFCRVGSDSIVLGNYVRWDTLNGSVIEAAGDKCIIKNNRLIGPSQKLIKIIDTRGANTIVNDNIITGSSSGK